MKIKPDTLPLIDYNRRNFESLLLQQVIRKKGCSMIGKTLGHYQVTEKLGEGGMGIVYKARDTRLDRFVALKVLPAEKVADPERKRRFVQEAKTVSALNHPNIVHVYDIDQADGTDFIAMEYVSGKTLYYTKPGRGEIQVGPIWKVAREGGEESQVLDREVSWNNWVLRPEGIYFSTSTGKRYTIELLDLGTGKTSTVFQEETPYFRAWLAISPDGQWLLYGNQPPGASDLMLVENFR